MTDNLDNAQCLQLTNERFGEQTCIRLRVKEGQGAPNLVMPLKTTSHCH